MKINPVLRKETKLMVRTWRIGLLLAIYVGVLALVGVSVFNLFLKSMTYGASFRELPMFYMGLEGLQFILILFIVPSLTATAISGERERQTLDILLSTKMSPFSIIIGKLMASLSKIMFLIIAAVPVFALTFIYGGISVKHILQLLLFYLVTSIFLGALGMFISAFFKSTRASNAMTYGIALLIVLGTLFITFIHFQVVMQKHVTAQATTPFVFNIPFYLYINPAAGFGSLMVNQIGLAFPVGARTLSQYTNFWIVNIVVQLVISAILIILASIKLNPVKKVKNKRKRKV